MHWEERVDVTLVFYAPSTGTPHSPHRTSGFLWLVAEWAGQESTVLDWGCWCAILLTMIDSSIKSKVSDNPAFCLLSLLSSSNQSCWLHLPHLTAFLLQGSYLPLFDKKEGIKLGISCIIRRCILKQITQDHEGCGHPELGRSHLFLVACGYGCCMTFPGEIWPSVHPR